MVAVLQQHTACVGVTGFHFTLFATKHVHAFPETPAEEFWGVFPTMVCRVSTGGRVPGGSMWAQEKSGLGVSLGLRPVPWPCLPIVQSKFTQMLLGQ
jgi:hypothetical protein